MIIVRSPLRVTLGGGGTDLPSYYDPHGGFVVSAAIDRYIYITLHETFVADFIVKYSKLERVSSAAKVEHPIVREAFGLMGLSGNYLEVVSVADIPAGTGLGSSGSFTTALLKALHTYVKHPAEAATIAEQACHIEIDRLGEPVGKQDQYIAAYGGITVLRIAPTGQVQVSPARLSEETRYNLEDNLLLFFTGYSRKASDILKDQHARSRSGDASMIDNLHEVRRLGVESLAALESGELHRFGELMHVHWENKRKRSGSISNSQIDEWYEYGRANGAIGGKVIGAGGGGFLMFYAEDKMRLRHAMREVGLTEIRFRFDFEGTKVIVQ